MELLGLVSGVFVQESSNHFLILSIIFLGLFFEKVNAGFAESKANYLFVKLDQINYTVSSYAKY